MASRTQYLAVAAIDFGTTYSGFALSFTRREGIYMNRKWGSEEGRETMKTPTTILLCPNKDFDSFGYEADERYVHFRRGEEKNYYYFKHFKMDLHKSRDLNRTTQLTAANGKKVDALTVFSLSLKYMKDKAVEFVRENTGDRGYNEKDIQWVLTVPAIWTPAAKQFMREAAYQAGIATPKYPEQLIIALEPEGAAIFCRRKKLMDFCDESGSGSVSDTLRPGARYVVMDIGGGTLDVTAHEILEDGRIKEVDQVTGGPFGGIFVDQKFVSLLEKKFGIQAVKNYRTTYPADWLRLMNDFEMKKRGKRTLEGKDTRIVLPQTFIRFISDLSPSALSDNLEKYCSISDVEVYNDEYLCLGPSAIKQLFEPVVNGILSHMTALLKKPSLRNINALLMVGGFAESAILQNAIRKMLGSRCKILIPRDARVAVVQGATMFGQTSTIVSSRVMATTYGFDGFAHFDSKIHLLEKKMIYEGVAMCKDIFNVVVKENDVVEVGERKVFTRFPVYSDQTLVQIVFFTSNDPSVQYTTDPPVGPSIGKMTVKSPDISKGKSRPIEISIYFGGTEIKATAVDKTSGNSAAVNLDFLCKS